MMNFRWILMSRAKSIKRLVKRLIVRKSAAKGTQNPSRCTRPSMTFNYYLFVSFPATFLCVRSPPNDFIIYLSARCFFCWLPSRAFCRCVCKKNVKKALKVFFSFVFARGTRLQSPALYTSTHMEHKRHCEVLSVKTREGFFWLPSRPFFSLRSRFWRK